MILLRFRGSNQTKSNKVKQSQTKPNKAKRKYSLSFVSAGPISPPSEPQYILLLICNYMYVLTVFFSLSVFSPCSLSLSLSWEKFSLSFFLPLYIHIYVHIYLYVFQGTLSLSLSLSIFSFILPFVFSLYISNYL